MWSTALLRYPNGGVSGELFVRSLSPHCLLCLGKAAELGNGGRSDDERVLDLLYSRGECAHAFLHIGFTAAPSDLAHILCA